MCQNVVSGAKINVPQPARCSQLRLNVENVGMYIRSVFDGMWNTANHFRSLHPPPSCGVASCICIGGENLQPARIRKHTRVVFSQEYLGFALLVWWAGTHYGLDGPGIECQRGRDFPHPSRQALGYILLAMQWVQGCSRGKAAGAWR